MKKKGFTLIELLAVIVILAIIALIITPLISDLIESSRYASAVDSVLAYVASANSQVAADSGIGGFEDFSLNLPEENELETGITDEELAKIKYKGKGPTYVYLHFDPISKQVSDAKFCIWGFSIDYDAETGTSKSDGYCDIAAEVLPDIEPEGKILCDVLRNNLYDSNDVFKIKSVEDLVCMSQMSASGKTYEGKTIYLASDIDFNEDSSYEDSNGTTLGDINGNGSVEGLKTELTTSKGFNPIGSSTTPFKGKFEGYAKSIYNLMINRSQNNVGLFGYNQGIIQGFTISANVKGNFNVGGVVGYNAGGIVKEILANVSVSSISNSNSNDFIIGGIVGNLESGSVTSVLLKSSIVSIPSNYLREYLGCIVGKTDNAANIISGVVESGSIRNDRGDLNSSDWKMGRISGSTSGTITGYVSTAVAGSGLGNNGTSYVLRNDMLSTYDKVLDTYIGGDNDNSGYYFDYENDESNNIVLKRTNMNPIRFTLKGKGTAEKPYIIDNYKHYKEATILAGNKNADDTYKSYKLKITADIDFDGKHYYALGTNGNMLTSDIDGDMHTLSNVTINCAENCGLISQSGKNIEGLNLNNITITSNNSNVGGLVGNNTGNIKGITANNMNITGYASVGGLVGYNNGGTINEVVASVSAASNLDRNQSNFIVGGVVGNLESGSVTNVLMKSSVVSIPNNYWGQYLGGIVGRTENTNNVISGVVESGSVRNSRDDLNSSDWKMGKITGSAVGTITGYASTAMLGSGLGNNGTSYVLRNEILNTYDKVLDTYIGGDNDASGYYFDYENDESNNIVIKRTKDMPITFTLAGSGTSNDPYLIDSYQHFKEATIKSNGNYVFKITNDIDFTGKHYYALGTNGNILGSDINGDMHTLSNISIGCAENCGLISQSSRTIEGLNLNNITITSNNSNIGGLVGNNTGTIKGINATNMNITGYASVGGLVGYNNGGTINEVAASVKAASNLDRTQSNFIVGGVVGNLESGSVTNVLMKSSVVSIPNNYWGQYLGGIVGRTENTNNVISGVVESGSVRNSRGDLNSSDWKMGKITGSAVGTITGYASTAMLGSGLGANGTTYTLIPPTTVSVSGSEIDSLTYYDNVGILDTIIGGDNDNSGYYLQYNNSADSIIVVKAGTSGGVVNPGGSSSSSPVPIIGESVGTNPPTCVLNEVIPRSNGIQAVLTCEDEEGAPTIRSQWNVNKNAVTNQFSDIGIIKNGSVNGNSKTVRPYWSTSDPISVPHRGDCYYYRFGAMDASGNYSYYVTENCYHAFTD